MSINEQQPAPDRLPQAKGNIWGWKFSMISLGIILFFLGLAVFRHWQMGIPFDLKNLMEMSPQDTVRTNNEEMKNEEMNNQKLINKDTLQ